MKLMTSFRPPPHYKANYEENFKDFPSFACALLTTLLDLDSYSRATAAFALESEVSYFYSLLLINHVSSHFYVHLHVFLFDNE